MDKRYYIDLYYQVKPNNYILNLKIKAGWVLIFHSLFYLCGVRMGYILVPETVL